MHWFLHFVHSFLLLFATGFGFYWPRLPPAWGRVGGKVGGIGSLQVGWPMGELGLAWGGGVGGGEWGGTCPPTPPPPSQSQTKLTHWAPQFIFMGWQMGELGLAWRVGVGGGLGFFEPTIVKCSILRAKNVGNQKK